MISTPVLTELHLCLPIKLFYINTNIDIFIFLNVAPAHNLVFTPDASNGINMVSFIVFFFNLLTV